MSTLANQFAARGIAVAVVTFLRASPRDYHLAAEVERFTLDIGIGEPRIVASLWRNARRIARLRALLEQWRPDVTVAFMESPNVASIIASRLTGRAVVVSERVDPRTYTLAQPWRTLRRMTYPSADLVVLQTDGVAAGWARTFLAEDRVAVLPNPLSVAVAAQPLPLDAREAVVLAAGRLSAQKGFDILVQAFARVMPAVPGMQLHIAGEGPEREQLQAQIDSLGLHGRVRLLGRVDDVTERMARARAFVMSSRFEGFPNALLEALAQGTPVASTDCRSGPREILGDSLAGALSPVDDPDALAAALLDVLTPARFDERARAALTVASRYDGPTVAGRWLDALDRAVARRSGPASLHR